MSASHKAGLITMYVPPPTNPDFCLHIHCRNCLTVRQDEELVDITPRLASIGTRLILRGTFSQPSRLPWLCRFFHIERVVSMTFAEWYDRNSLSCRVPELDAGPNIFVDAATSLFARGGTRIPVTLVLE